MDSLARYGTIYHDARSDAYVARRWDGKCHSRRPLGCPLAWDRIEIFLRDVGEPPEKAPTKAPCTSALTTPTTQAELGKKASGTEGMETMIAKSVAASSTGHTALLHPTVIPTPIQKLPNLQCVDKAANLTSGTVGYVQADQVVDTAVTSSSSASHPSTALSKRSDLHAAACVVATPGQWQGLFTALVFSVAYRIKVSIHFGTSGHIADQAQHRQPLSSAQYLYIKNNTTPRIQTTVSELLQRSPPPLRPPATAPLPPTSSTSPTSQQLTPPQRSPPPVRPAPIAPLPPKSSTSPSLV